MRQKPAGRLQQCEKDQNPVKKYSLSAWVYTADHHHILKEKRERRVGSHRTDADMMTFIFYGQLPDTFQSLHWIETTLLYVRISKKEDMTYFLHAS